MFEDLVDIVWLILWILEVLGLLFMLNFDLFPIAPLFLWVLATYPIFYPPPCPWPHYNLKRPFDPYVHVY